MYGLNGADGRVLHHGEMVDGGIVLPQHGYIFKAFTLPKPNGRGFDLGGRGISGTGAQSLSRA